MGVGSLVCASILTCLPVSAQITTAIWKPGTGLAVLLTPGQDPTGLDSVVSKAVVDLAVHHKPYAGPPADRLRAELGRSPRGLRRGHPWQARPRGGESPHQHEHSR